MLLFVYGSLLRGMSLSHVMKGTRFLGPALIKADLYFLGFYPGIAPGDQPVFGELYEVPESILPKIDDAEDFIELNHEKSLYLRKPIDAIRFSDGIKVKANAYYYNRPSDGYLRIDCGDYRIFMNKIKNCTSWLVSYERYLESESIISELGFIPDRKEGFIHGFTKVYNVKSGINGYAYANLNFEGQGSACKSIAWKLNDDHLKKIDKQLSVPNLYKRISIPFITAKNETIIAQTYLANPEYLAKSLHPLTDRNAILP